MEPQMNEEAKGDVLHHDELAKKPYEKPQIVYSAPLEAMAVVCLPHPPGKGNSLQCSPSNVNS